MKVLITGSRGMLGSDTVNTLSEHGVNAVSSGREHADITVKGQFESLVSACLPDIIVHCAAYTKVDDCEKNRELAFKVNAEGTRLIAEAAAGLKIPLIYISTDYVFDGDSTQPYREDDPPNPINVYGESKLRGENYIRELCKNFYIVRTSWLFGKNGANFVDSMRKLMEKGVSPIKVVNDQRGSPTYSLHLADAIWKIIEKVSVGKGPPSGIYNVTGDGDCTWYELSRKIAGILKYGHEIIPVSTGEFPRDATRPAYSVLDNTLVFNDFGIKMPHWEAAVEEYLSS